MDEEKGEVVVEEKGEEDKGEEEGGRTEAGDVVDILIEIERRYSSSALSNMSMS